MARGHERRRPKGSGADHATAVVPHGHEWKAPGRCNDLGSAGCRGESDCFARSGLLLPAKTREVLKTHDKRFRAVLSLFGHMTLAEDVIVKQGPTKTCPSLKKPCPYQGRLLPLDDYWPELLVKSRLRRRNTRSIKDGE